MDEFAQYLSDRMGGTRSEKGWHIACPVHGCGDKALITVEDGGFGLSCEAGCQPLDMVGAMQDRGIWPSRRPTRTEEDEDAELEAAYRYLESRLQRSPSRVRSLPVAEQHVRRRVLAPELMKKEIPPVRWAIEPIVPEGLTLLGGKSKTGKSWMALDIALAVASGGQALGCLRVERGQVVYLALEDDERRLQDRCRALLEEAAAPDDLEFWTRCPKLDEGGLGLLEGWLRAHQRARLVIVDTLKRVRGRRPGRSAYDEDYECLIPLGELARRYRVAVLVVHHLRKQGAQDPVDLLSGSIGLSAAADGLLILRRARGQEEAHLHVVHREGEERTLALQFEAETCKWQVVGDGEPDRMSEERREVVELLRERGQPMTPKEIAEALGRNRPAVRVLVHRMVQAGEILAVGPGYVAPGSGERPAVTDASALLQDEVRGV